MTSVALRLAIGICGFAASAVIAATAAAPLPQSSWSPSASARAGLRGELRRDFAEASGREGITRGLAHGYNLDYPEALAAFEQAIALDPNDATAHRLAAAAIWMHMLFEQGAVTAEDYLGQARAKVARRPPSPELAARFARHLDRATAIAEQRLQNNPSDADAHFQLGAAAGFRASYTATIEGRVFDSIGPARRAFSENKRCLALDPARKDAGLTVGLYRYGISSLSLPVRLMARIAGFQGGRDQGLQFVEDAAKHESHVQTNALFVLIVIYNREQRFDEALAIIRQLQERYPRNRLLWLEAGSTTLRAGRPAEALAALDRGLAQLATDPRPRAFGEEARWRFQRALALNGLGDRAEGQRLMQTVLASEAPQWLRDEAKRALKGGGK
jgi:tetratricopeptide (TPR) repeat protein